MGLLIHIDGDQSLLKPIARNMSQKVGEWGYKCDNRHIVLNNLKLVTTGIDYLYPKRLSSTPTHQHHNPHHIHRRISFQKFQQRLIDHCSYQWNNWLYHVSWLARRRASTICTPHNATPMHHSVWTMVEYPFIVANWKLEKQASQTI